MAKLGRIPRLDFVPDPGQYRLAGSGNGNGHKTPPRKPPRSLDLSPRLALTVQCETIQVRDPEFEDAHKLLVSQLYELLAPKPLPK